MAPRGMRMHLGSDEIKRRAKAFSEEWQGAHYERGQTQTFYPPFSAPAVSVTVSA